MLPPSREAWQDLDAAQDSQRLVEFLDQFAELPCVRAAKSRSFELLEPSPGARLLDAGCGTGRDALALLAEVLPGGEVLGVDVSARALLEADRNAAGRDGISFRQGDVTALPYPAGHFDGSRADRTLVHVPKPELAVAELVRVTRPGGKVVISEAMLLDAEPDVENGRRKQARHALAFLPLLLSKLGVQNIFIDRSEASVVLSGQAAEIIRRPEGDVRIRFVHLGGTVGQLA